LRKIFFIIGLFFHIGYSDILYWHNGDQKERIYKVSTDDNEHTYIYSPTPFKTRQLILSGNIIIQFNKAPSKETIKEFEDKYRIKLIKKIKISKGFYLFGCISKEQSLNIANEIYENEPNIKASYPDWIQKYR